MEAYSRFDIETDGITIDEDDVTGRGPVVVWCETNDNDDDGYAGPGDFARWALRYPTVLMALERSGIERRGAYGQPVHVTLDGVTVTEEVARSHGWRPAVERRRR